jgi:hypothetical protein
MSLSRAMNRCSEPGGRFSALVLVPRRLRQRNAAFTLIEVVISGALMALILVSAYLCFNAAIAGQKLIEPRIEVFQNARVAMALMTADLRAACPLSKDVDLLGMHRMLGEVPADNLDFATHHYTPSQAREADFCQTSFYLDKDPESDEFILWRRRNPRIALDPLSGGSREELARGLRGVRFEYYDGIEWYDSWGEVKGKAKAESSNRYHGNLEGLPEAVRITLWFDSQPRSKRAQSSESAKAVPPLIFQTVARLNLADSALSGGADANGPEPADQPGAEAGARNPGRNP